ncbi:MAG: hypothetical protein WBC93_08745 [Sulfitobacter sp.]
MKQAILLVAILAALGGCNRKDRLSFDGQYYRTKISKVDGQRHVFAVTSSPVSASLKGALEAARYKATEFCVNDYGSSEIEWVIGPDQDEGTYVVTNDALTLQGACPL